MAKDWKGNSNSIYKTLGASNHCSEEREENDFYATPPCATKALIKYCKENNINIFSNAILEPACGKGHIVEVLVEENPQVPVLPIDLVDRGYEHQLATQNFFLYGIADDANYNIITNPPYARAKEFIEHSLDIVKPDSYVCMLLKITFLEGKGRYEMFKNNPPYKVLIFSNRVNCSKQGDFEKDSEYGGAVGYAWYIWKKGYTGKPEIDWIMA
jgi:hypothetical protein